MAQAKQAKADKKSDKKSGKATKGKAKDLKAKDKVGAKAAAEVKNSKGEVRPVDEKPAKAEPTKAASTKAAPTKAKVTKVDGGTKPQAKRPAGTVDDRELEPDQAKQLIEQVAAEIMAADEASADPSEPGAGFADLLRLKPGAPVDLASVDTHATPGVSSRAQAEAQLACLSDRVSELQERLYAAAVGGGSPRRVLLVLQGMDTAGKGGTVRHVVSLLDPNGTRLKAFKAPTEEEREHDFLWRIRPNLPDAGQVAIFDRSHYEDVLAAKVRKLALPMHIGRRYGLINRFEKSLVDEGCVVLKCFLHISFEEQRERLLARLENPNKHWKYSPGDVDDRLLWPDYQDAYRIALERCGTDAAPWHVIPADRKWFRNHAVLRLLIEALESIDPQYPPGRFDVAAERARVLAS